MKVYGILNWGYGHETKSTKVWKVWDCPESILKCYF